MGPERAHAKVLPPSGSYRWMSCPASAWAQAGHARRGSSIHAELGTLAHAWAELMLREGDRDALAYLDAPIALDGYEEPQTLGEDMARAVQYYLDACWEAVDAAEGRADWRVERRVPVPVWPAPPDEVFGTCDFACYDPATRILEIVDFKHGYVFVEARENTQLLIYALAVMVANNWRPVLIRTTIVQPRAWAASGVTRTWELTTGDLMEFSGDLDRAVARVYAEPDTYVPGRHCRYCAIGWRCHALRDAALAIARTCLALDGTLYAENLPDPKRMTMDELAVALGNVALLETWSREVHNEARQRMLAGHAVPGYKVVEKQARRRWTGAEADIAKGLMETFELGPDEVWRTKLATITDVEERVLKGHRGEKRREREVALGRHTVRESHGYDVAPVDDGRPAVCVADRTFEGFNAVDD